MPQNEHIELFRKRYGRRFDYFEKKRKKEARLPRIRSQYARKLTGLKAKIYNRQRYKEKIQMQKTIRLHQKKQTGTKKESDTLPQGAVPAYLLDRENQNRQVLVNMEL